MPDESGFVDIAAGSRHGLALKSDGTLAGWGANLFGESCVPEGDNFVAIDGGWAYSAALVPEPATIFVLGFGVIILAVKRK